MRFGISATSLMCPKNLRTRLRPVNVCCAIVASHFVARHGRTFRSAIGIAPGLNPDTSPNSESQLRFIFLDPTMRPSERKTTREAGLPLRPSQPSVSRTEKARNLPVSQRLNRDTSPFPPLSRAFVLPSRYGMAIMEIRGVFPQIPTQSCVQLDQDALVMGSDPAIDALFSWRSRLAALARDFVPLVLVMAGLGPAIHVLRLWRSRVSLRSPGISLK